MILPDECAKCGGRFERGFMVDRGDMQIAGESTWASGEPNRSLWRSSAIRKDARQHPVTVLRCTRCGYLESYAPG